MTQPYPSLDSHLILRDSLPELHLYSALQLRKFTGLLQHDVYNTLLVAAVDARESAYITSIDTIGQRSTTPPYSLSLCTNGNRSVRPTYRHKASNIRSMSTQKLLYATSPCVYRYSRSVYTKPLHRSSITGPTVSSLLSWLLADQ